MTEGEKVVLRFINGHVLKGFIREFTPEKTEFVLEDVTTNKIHTVRIDELKAIFFVRSFEGNREYNEKKKYGISKTRGNRVYIQFKDKEHLVGFLDGDVPWEHGFYLSKSAKNLKGFFLLPADLDANNLKIFVVTASIEDVTVVP